MGFRLKLFLRFGIFFSILFIILILLLWVQSRWAGGGEEKFLKEERIHRGEVLARTLAYYNLDNFLLKDEITVQDNLSRIKKENSEIQYVAIVDEEGKPFAKEGEELPTGLNSLKEEEILVQETTTKEGKEIFDVRVPMKVGGKKKAEIHLGILAPVVGSQKKPTDSFKFHFLFLGIGILGSLLLALITRPPSYDLQYDPTLAGYEEEEAHEKKIAQLKEEESRHVKTLEDLKRQEETFQKERGIHQKSLESLKQEMIALQGKLAEAKNLEGGEDKAMTAEMETLRKERMSLSQHLEETQKEKEILIQEIMDKTQKLEALRMGADQETSQKIEAKLNEELTITQRIVAKRREEIALSQRLEAKRKEELELTRKIEALKSRF